MSLSATVAFLVHALGLQLVASEFPIKIVLCDKVFWLQLVHRHTIPAKEISQPRTQGVPIMMYM